MKKVLVIIAIFGSLMAFQNYLQNYHNKSIIKKTVSSKSYDLEAYLMDWDSNYLYLSTEDDKKFKLKLSPRTKFFRTYVNENDVLNGQKQISLSDFVKEQFVSADVIRDSKEDIDEVLILRQLIYVSP